MRFVIAEVDPQGKDAMALLREAAIEARMLYPELHGPNDPWPTNGPTPPRGAYFIAYLDGLAVSMGSHRPLDSRATELRRMFTTSSARKLGAARAILASVERHAREQHFVELMLETGFKQGPAIALYQSMGFKRIEPFGAYKDDPTSVCFAKLLACSEASQETPDH